MKNKTKILCILIVSIIISSLSFKMYNVYSISNVNSVNNDCNLEIKKVNYYYDKVKDITYAKIAISFKWNDNIEKLKGKDIIGIAWSEDFSVDSKNTYINIKYTYNNQEVIKTNKGSRTEVNLYRFVFPEAVTEQHLNRTNKYEILSGEGMILLSKRGNHPNFTIYTEYGESNLNSNLKVKLEDRFVMQFSDGIIVRDYASLNCGY